MSKVSDTEQEVDAVVAAYREAMATAAAARVIADAAQAKAWKAEANYDAAVAAREGVFESAANVHLGPHEENES